MTTPIFKVKVKSTVPPGAASWQVDLGDDPRLALIYTNIGYALISHAMSRLGVAMSDAVLGDDKALVAMRKEIEAAG